MYNGVRYASRSEASYAAMLDVMQRCGQVRWWIGQPRFRLGIAENVYVADFLVQYDDDTCAAIDVKGVATSKFRRDCVLWRRYGRIPLKIVRRERGGSWSTETIWPPGTTPEQETADD
jgi:hypothetical protein